MIKKTNKIANNHHFGIAIFLTFITLPVAVLFTDVAIPVFLTRAFIGVLLAGATISGYLLFNYVFDLWIFTLEYSKPDDKKEMIINHTRISLLFFWFTVAMLVGTLILRR
jgi:hypothetical protein